MGQDDADPARALKGAIPSRRDPRPRFMVDLLVRLEELTIGNEGAQLFPRVLSTTQLEDLGFAFSAQPRDQEVTGH